MVGGVRQLLFGAWINRRDAEARRGIRRMVLVGSLRFLGWCGGRVGRLEASLGYLGRGVWGVADPLVGAIWCSWGRSVVG